MASSQFLSYFVSLDSYGDPFKITYKGKSTYQTEIGALFTLGMNIFMLIFVGLGFLDLMNYKNP